MSGQFVPAAVETFEGAATGPGASNGGPVAADAGRALALRDWALAALDGVASVTFRWCCVRKRQEACATLRR